jgi:chemotaxis regulatin CheY-phosphate phosphatase CheZ
MDVLQSNIDLFATLKEKFPNVEVFKTQHEKNESVIQSAGELLETLQNSGDSIMNVMDIMQYQDIHRQKIERVINVMRALSGYMNALFEGRVEDDKRVGSATHLPGDTSTEDIVNSDDIEALLESFGQK